MDEGAPHGLRNWLTDFDLVCAEVNHELSWLTTAFFIGFLVSSFLSMWAADRVGRRPIILPGLLLQILINLGLLFLPKHLGFLYAYMTLLGVRAPMGSHVASVLNLEFGMGHVRGYLTATTTLLDNSTGILLPLFFYYVGDWRILFYINTAITLVCFLLILLVIPESPRFYLGRHDYVRAKLQFRKLARMNGKTMFTAPLLGEPESQGFLPPAHPGSSTLSAPSPLVVGSPRSAAAQENCCLLLKKGSPYRVVTVVVPFLFLTIDVIFYGIIFGLNELKGSIYVNGVVAGSADIVAAGLIALLSERVPRKVYILCTWGLITVATLFYHFFSSHEYVSYACVLLGKLGATSTFSMLFFIAIETFPTQHRSTMMGVSNGFARVGGALAPILKDRVSWFMLVFALLGAVSFVCSLFLKETLGYRMVDTVSEPRERKRKTISDPLLEA